MKGPNKHALSNQLRLDSIHKKRESETKSKLLIKNALNNLDKAKKRNQHIKFDDDSSDSDTRETSKKAAPKLKKVADDALGIDAASSDDNEIQIKPQFDGKGGKKLLEIQARTGMDCRFKMDERFAESDSSLSDEEKNVAQDYNLEHLDEKKRNLAILQQVVGTAATARSLKRKGTTFKDPDTKRYDPTKEGHAKLEVAQVGAVAEKKKKRKKREEKPVPVNKTKFYETSATVLKSAFGKTDREKDKETETGNDNEENQTFSFLKMFGRKPDEENSSDEDRTPYFHEDIPDKNTKLASQFGGKAFKHDSSDSETEAEDSKETVSQLVDGGHTADPTPPTTLFLTSRNDPRVVEGPRLFCSNKTMDEMRQEWLECKDELKADYKKKHRNARKLLNRDRNHRHDGFEEH